MEREIQALHNLTPGKSYVYYRGFLDSERLNNPHSDAVKVADAAYAMMQAGQVLLTQRRMSPPSISGGIINWKMGIGTGFEYIATGAIPKKRRRILEDLLMGAKA